MSKYQILVIDDEKNIRRSMELILKSEGYNVVSTESGEAALKFLQQNQPDAIFLDVMLPQKDGLTILKEIKEAYSDIDIIMISGHATLDMAVEATKAGAYDFMEKPLQKEKILLILNHLFENKRLKDRYHRLKMEVEDEYQILGISPAIEKLREELKKVAVTDSKVLIQGESGTGKELAAWAIHEWSERRAHPFIKMNCAAIPLELTESELFGYEKGAFTGANERRDGKFTQADLGTLFLDEIADMSLAVQTKVLRVLQDGNFERVGGKETQSVDVRVVAATNKNLENLVNEGQFREDLFYRLNVLPINIPPLRERPEDITILIDHFITRYCKKNNRRAVEIDQAALQKLQAYHWPGNIRELQNMIERLVIMASGEGVTEKDLPHHIFDVPRDILPTDQDSLTLKAFREKTDREFIQSVLQKCDGNVSEAARLLGVERTNLHKKMKALGIDR
jgi:two-component system nitrogen regulation response regulator NtrX